MFALQVFVGSQVFVSKAGTYFCWVANWQAPKLAYMKFGTNKHSSLFDLIVSDEENTFYDISPLVSSKWEERTIDVGLACCHFNKTFFFVTYYLAK